MEFVRFMAGPIGRALRIAAGMALVVYGVVYVGGTTGDILAAVGAIPILAGLFNFCLLAPLFHAPLLGSRLVDQPH